MIHCVGEWGCCMMPRSPRAKAPLHWAVAWLGSSHSQLRDALHRKDKNSLKATLGMYLFRRKCGKEERRSLRPHILFVNGRIWGLVFSKSEGVIFRFSCKNDFVFGNLNTWLANEMEIQRSSVCHPLGSTSENIWFPLAATPMKKKLGCRNVSQNEC